MEMGTISRETCTIRDITVDGAMARIAFELDNGDVLEKMIRDSEVDMSAGLKYRM